MVNRRHIPTKLKIVRGNPGRRPLPENEPQPEVGAVAPSWLSPEAAQYWPEVARQLEEADVLTKMDAQALALYCDSFARWRTATEAVAKFGMIVKAPSGYPVQSPWLAIANRAGDTMLKILIEFGMTPSSRARVSTTGNAAKKKQQENPAAQFFR